MHYRGDACVQGYRSRFQILDRLVLNWVFGLRLKVAPSVCNRFLYKERYRLDREKNLYPMRFGTLMMFCKKKLLCVTGETLASKRP